MRHARPQHRQAADERVEDLEVQRAHGGSIPGYAYGTPDGGAGAEGSYNPYDPAALEPRRDTGKVVYVSPNPTPGSVPVDTGAGGGGESRSDGSGGGPGWYGPGTISRPDMGSGAASGGPSGNQIPPAEANAMRSNAPAMATAPASLPPGVVQRGKEQPTPAPPPTAQPKPRMGGQAPRPAGPADDYGEVAADADIGRIQAGAAEQQGRDALERRKVHEQYARNEMDTRERAKLAASEMMSRSQAVIDDMKRIDATVDPDRYWASKSTGQKILGAIGLALGSLSPDGVNRAAQMMGAAIDRDIEAQKAEHSFRLQKGDKALQGLQSMYAQQHQVFGDELAATSAAKVSALELAADTAEAQGAKYTSELAKANAAKFAAVARRAAETSRADLKLKAADEGYKRAETAKAYMEANAKGGTGPASKEEVAKLHSAEGDAQSTLDLIRGLKSSLKKTQSSVPGVTALNQNFGDEAQNLESMAESLQLKIKNMEQLGAISTDDSARLMRLVGDPQKIWGKGSSEESKLNRLQALEAETLNAIRNKRNAAMGARAQ
jgi:hypothetical protein